jgi:hypothetical protein
MSCLSVGLLPIDLMYLDRSVSEGHDIFGDGNMEMTMSQFEKDHVCNKYCEWPAFGLEAYASGAESETSK